MAANEEIFKIISVDHADNVIKAILSINDDSLIFKGHFPEHPVIPGACMLQVVKDVLANAVGYAVQLKKGDNLKFIGMIEPGGTDITSLEMSYKLSEEGIGVIAKLSEGDRVCFKFQGIFVRL